MHRRALLFLTREIASVIFRVVDERVNLVTPNERSQRAIYINRLSLIRLAQYL